MEKTENYGLNQWDAQDAIKREDFNTDNAKIDAALGALAQASAGHGNCKIECGSYKGTGAYGSENPTVLTFEHKPLLVAIMPNAVSDNSTRGLILVCGSGVAYSYPGYYNSKCTVTWTSASVSWYNGASTDYQFSKSSTYNYVALLAADE